MKNQAAEKHSFKNAFELQSGTNGRFSRSAPRSFQAKLPSNLAEVIRSNAVFQIHLYFHPECIL